MIRGLDGFYLPVQRNSVYLTLNTEKEDFCGEKNNAIYMKRLVQTRGVNRTVKGVVHF